MPTPDDDSLTRRRALDAARKAFAQRQKKEPPPPQVPGFRNLRRLDFGGEGTVYEASRADGHLVAIKVFHRRPLSVQEHTEFVNRATALQNKPHPFVVATLRAGTLEDGRCFHIMERVQGKRLNEFINDRQLTLPDSLRLFRKVVMGFEYLHSLGIVHSDVKPSNILVDDHGTPTIIDFNMMRQHSLEVPLDEPTSQHQRAAGGTLQFMSPEHLRGVDPTTQSDLYSLGVTFFLAFTGEYPYARFRSTAEIRHAILEEQPRHASSIRRDIPDDIDAILLNCLRKDEPRYRTAGELGADLERYFSRTPVIPRILQKLKQYPRIIRCVSVLAILGFIASGVLYYRSYQQARTSSLHLRSLITEFLNKLSGYDRGTEREKDEIQALQSLVDHDDQLTDADRALARAAIGFSTYVISHDLAESKMRAAVQDLETQRPASDEDLMIVKGGLAAILCASRKPEAATGIWRDLVATEQAARGVASPLLHQFLCPLAYVLLEVGPPDEAVARLREAIDSLSHALPTNASVASFRMIARFLDDHNRTLEAIQIGQSLLARSTTDSWTAASFIQIVGNEYRLVGNSAEALRLLKEAKHLLGSEAPFPLIQDVSRDWCRALLSNGQLTDAATVLQELRTEATRRGVHRELARDDLLEAELAYSRGDSDIVLSVLERNLSDITELFGSDDDETQHAWRMYNCSLAPDEVARGVIVAGRIADAAPSRGGDREVCMRFWRVLKERRLGGTPYYDRSIIERTLELTRKACGENSNEVANAQLAAGSLCASSFLAKDAEQLLRSALTTCRTDRGDTSLIKLSVEVELANLLLEQGRIEEARTLANHARSIEKTLTLEVLRAADALVSISRASHDHDAAEMILREEGDYYRARKLDASDTLALLGSVLMEQSKYVDAEPVLIEAYDAYCQSGKRGSSGRCLVAGRLARLYEELGKTDESAQWRERCQRR